MHEHRVIIFLNQAVKGTTKPSELQLDYIVIFMDHQYGVSFYCYDWSPRLRSKLCLILSYIYI